MSHDHIPADRPDCLDGPPPTPPASPYCPSSPLNRPHRHHTPPALSGSQLTFQLRERASQVDYDIDEQLLNTAADVIDRLTRELADLSSRKPRPVVIQLPAGARVPEYDDGVRGLLANHFPGPILNRPPRS